MRASATCTLAMLLGVARVAHADGFYYAESFGFAESRGDIHHYLADAFHVRLGIGMRIGNLEIEPWLAADKNLGDADDVGDAAIARSNGPTGRVDIGAYGLDLKYLTPIVPSFPHLEVYVRGGVGLAQPTGALDGYLGGGFGVGSGIQLKGRVRALGFLWTPMFFFKRGPMVTGAIYIDDGLDWYTLHRDGDPAIGVELVHISMGFAVGSDF